MNQLFDQSQSLMTSRETLQWSETLTRNQMMAGMQEDWSSLLRIKSNDGNSRNLGTLISALQSTWI